MGAIIIRHQMSRHHRYVSQQTKRHVVTVTTHAVMLPGGAADGREFRVLGFHFELKNGNLKSWYSIRNY